MLESYRYGILKGGILAERFHCTNRRQLESRVRDLVDISAGFGREVWWILRTSRQSEVQSWEDWMALEIC